VTKLFLGKSKNVNLFLLNAVKIESPLTHESFMVIHDYKIMFCKNSSIFTVSGLKKGENEIKPKMYSEVT
jgi:hypothetical protein